MAEDEQALKGNSKYYNKQVSQEFKKIEQGLTSAQTKVKQALVRKKLHTEAIQDLLATACEAIKDAKDFMSEHSKLSKVSKAE